MPAVATRKPPLKPDPMPESDAEGSVGDELARWGKVILLETRGRVTGRPTSAAVGFVEATDGSLLVAAGDANADWALNLAADPRCHVRLEETGSERRAERLGDAEHHQAVVALILKYGTPAERLGAGPAFRLVAGTPAAPGG